MILHVPPKNEGQIVTVSYGSDGEFAYCCVHDASDGSLSWSRIAWSDAWNSVPEGTDIAWEPWNQEPSMPCAWKPCEAPEYSGT